MTTNATRRARQHKIIAEHERTIAALRADNAKKDAALREAHHGLVTSHNLRATDLTLEQQEAHIAKGALLKNLEWVTDNSKEIAAVEVAIASAAQGEADVLADLVARFSAAILEKARAAEAKYGWNNAWRRDGWADTLRRHLREHVEKGDPRDVAIYAAFAWHHKWSLAPAPSAGETREATIKECAKVAELEGSDHDTCIEIAAAIRSLARDKIVAIHPAPTTGETALVPLRKALAQWDEYQPDISRDGIVRQADAMASAIRGLLAAAPTTGETTMRYCDYCKSWQSKPCGEGCVWTPDMPTALAAAPTTGEPTREAIIEECAKVARSAQQDRPGLGWRAACVAIEKRLRALAAAPTTGETCLQRTLPAQCQMPGGCTTREWCEANACYLDPPAPSAGETVLRSQEATEEMIDAARGLIDRWFLSGHSLAIREVWSAMLAAAPTTGETP